MRRPRESQLTKAPLPGNEAERLAALEAYEILDTAPEVAFDDLVTVAARICGTPIALISLVDEHRQWFKARVGLEASETPRELAFCAHAILNPEETMVVRDARDDPRFSDNPLVASEPRVTFYAGAPLITPDGLPLGTLCVIDHEPREFSDHDRATLQSLARATVNQLELQMAGRDLRSLSRDLARSNEDLERRNAEIRRFYQHLSHELKTPLTVTRDYVSMVLEGLVGEITEEQREFLTVGITGCDQMTSHVHDLLDLTRIETGKLSLEIEPTRFDQFLESTVFALTPSAEGAGIRLFWGADPGLPELIVDQGRLTQVLNNLIRNAIKFTPEGGEIEVTAALLATCPQQVEVSVRDTGRGIPEADLDDVFDRLFQCSDEDARSQQGLGLGLHLCREIVGLHGGEISVESELGHGSTFSFRLPVETTSSAQAERPLRERAET